MGKVWHADSLPHKLTLRRRGGRRGSCSCVCVISSCWRLDVAVPEQLLDRHALPEPVQGQDGVDGGDALRVLLHEVHVAEAVVYQTVVAVAAVVVVVAAVVALVLAVLLQPGRRHHSQRLAVLQLLTCLEMRGKTK